MSKQSNSAQLSKKVGEALLEGTLISTCEPSEIEILDASNKFQKLGITMIAGIEYAIYQLKAIQQTGILDIKDPFWNKTTLPWSTPWNPLQPSWPDGTPIIAMTNDKKYTASWK